MPAITIADLNNAKDDVDHIAEIATSTAPTSTDRLGNVKPTLKGKFDEIDELVATQIGDLTTATESASASASAASTSEVNAANSAALAQSGGVAVPYASVAAGVAATVAGQIFDVAPVVGLFHYRYLRSGASDAGFVGMVALTPAAQAVRDVLIAAKSPYLVPPLPAGVTHMWDLTTARKWDGRLAENLVSNVQPTLNLVPDPFGGMLDEQGDTTPTRSENDVTVTDPLGTNKAIVLGYVSALVPLDYFIRANSPNLPSDNYVQSVYLKTVDGTTGTMRLGATNTVGEYNTLAPTGSWSQLTRTSTGYSPASAFDLGLTTHTGTTTFNVAAFNLQMYDSRGGTILPTHAQEFVASQAGHLKAPSAFIGAFPPDAFGWVKAGSGFDNLFANMLGDSVSELSFGGVVDVQTNPASAQAILLGVGPHVASGISGSTRGQLGVLKDTYRLYCNPSLAAAQASSIDMLLNQGPVHLGITLKASQITAYINGVPQFMDTTSASALAWNAFNLFRMTALGSDNLKKRRQAGNKLADPVGYLWVGKGKCFTDAEMVATHRYLCALARMEGKPMGAHKNLTVGGSDSLVAFTDAPFRNMNHSGVQRLPGVHVTLDAVGGSNYWNGVGSITGSYNDPVRQAFRRRMLASALAAGYEQVLAFWPYGRNDIGGGIMNTLANWEAGRDTIDAMIMADKAAAIASAQSMGYTGPTARMKTALGTVLPYAGETATATSIRLAYNAASKTDYLGRGYDYLLKADEYVPAGWASLDAASLDALSGGPGGTMQDNDVFLGGGLHWSTTGGQNAATALYVPFFSAIAATLVGSV